MNAMSVMQGTTIVMDINTNTPGAPPVASSLDCCLACMSNTKVLRSSCFRKQGIYSLHVAG